MGTEKMLGIALDSILTFFYTLTFAMTTVGILYWIGPGSIAIPCDSR